MDPIFGNKEKPVTKWLDVQMTHLTARIGFIEVTKDNYREIFARNKTNFQRFNQHCHGVINILAVYKGKYWSFSQSVLDVTQFNKVTRVLTAVFNKHRVKEILDRHDTQCIKLTKFIEFIHTLNGGNEAQVMDADNIRFFVLVDRSTAHHTQAMLFQHGLEWINLKTNLQLKNEVHLISHAMFQQWELNTKQLKDENDELIMAVMQGINKITYNSLSRLLVSDRGSGFLVFRSRQEYHYYLKSKHEHPERYVNPLRVSHSSRLSKSKLRIIVEYWEDKTIETFKKHKCQCKMSDVFLN